MSLQNTNLVCLESIPSRIAGIKVFAAFLFGSFSIYWGFKNTISVKISRESAFFPFSTAYTFLIDFSKISKILKFTFPYNQPRPLNILWNWEHGMEYLSQNCLSNFHKIFILLPKYYKKIRKKNITLLGKRLDLKVTSNVISVFWSNQ